MQRLLKTSVLLIVALLLLAAPALTGCSGEDDTTTTTEATEDTSATTEADTATTEAAAERQELSFAMSGLYKPFNYQDEGELVGFDVDIGKALAEKMGVEAAPVTNPWETIIQGLKSDKYDAIIGSMAITEDRLEQVDFSRPYYRSGAQIFVAEDNSDITSEEDLDGKKIGTLKASTFKDIAVTLTAEDNIIDYDSDVIALQDLVTGRADAVITDQVVGFSAMNENDLAIKPVADPLYVDEMGIAVQKGDAELLDEVNAALEEMIADGTYDEISNEWFGRSILGE